jgi:hypothetical protein
VSLIIPGQTKGRAVAEGERGTRRTAWVFLASGATVITLVGLVRIGFFVVPLPDPNNAEWLFWNARSALDSLWVPALGAVLAMTACLNLHRMGSTRLLVLVFLLLALLAAASGLGVLRAGPAVMESGADPDAATLMLRAAILAGVQAPGFVWIALVGWRCAQGRA